MSILRTVACVAVVVLAASLVSAIPISQSGNGTPNNLPAATAGYTNNPANCGQVELDIFNLGQTGTPLQDLFQYITNSGGQGVNFAATTPYIITLPTAIFNGGVDLQIILSSLQGFYSSSTGLSGPFNATIDTITVTLNGLFTITQTFNPKGNNFSFNASNTPFQGTNTSVVVNNFTVSIFQLFPAQSGLPTNGTCAVAYVLEVTNPNIRGDPQFIGLRGQSYQIHGIDGEVYNIISGSTYQLNSRFAYLTGPRPCPAMPSTGKKSSACWTHPGSYLGELGLKLKDQNVEVFISAGPAATGFSSVTVNGKSLEIGSTTNVVSFNSTHEATLTFGPWTIQVENSDMFVNLRSVSVNVRTWSELSTVHGLLGQTWSNKRYSGSVNVIEGEVDDYHVQENSVFGDSFIYNKFQ